jgi:steroid delta-isomerase-like uncharacterized protein
MSAILRMFSVPGRAMLAANAREGTDMGHTTESIHRCIAAYNRHDAADFAASWTEGGVLRVMASGPVYEGRDQIEAGALERFRAFPDWHLHLHGVYECGEHAWLEWTVTGTHKGEFFGIPPTHRPFEVAACSHMTFAPDGLFASDDVYFDMATLLRQLGLFPDLEASQSA